MDSLEVGDSAECGVELVKGGCMGWGLGGLDDNAVEVIDGGGKGGWGFIEGGATGG